MMPSASRSNDQRFPSLLDATSANVRAALCPVEIVHRWSYAMLDAGDWSKSERQQLWDMRRAHREMAIRRSPLGLLLTDFAPRVALNLAIWGPMQMKCAVFAAGEYHVAPEHEMNLEEERTNYDGNIAQHHRRAHKTRSTALDVADTMHAQSLAGEMLALSTMRNPS